MTHAELVDAIGGRADMRGLWWQAWQPDQRKIRGHAGWVDLVILGPGGGLAVEVKSEGATRTRDQQHVAQLLHEARWPYRLWFPRDLDSGLVDEALDALR